MFWPLAMGSCDRRTTGRATHIPKNRLCKRTLDLLVQRLKRGISWPVLHVWIIWMVWRAGNCKKCRNRISKTRRWGSPPIFSFCPDQWKYNSVVYAKKKEHLAARPMWMIVYYTLQTCPGRYQGKCNKTYEQFFHKLLVIDFFFPLGSDASPESKSRWYLSIK